MENNAGSSGIDEQFEKYLDDIEDNKVEEVRRYLKSNQAAVNKQDEEGFSPLMIAAHCGNEATAALLITKKSNVNYYKSEDNCDALMCASQSGLEHI